MSTILLSVDEAARRLSISRSQLHAHVATGNVAGVVRIGRFVRIPAAEVDRIASVGLPVLTRAAIAATRLRRIA